MLVCSSSATPAAMTAKLCDMRLAAGIKAAAAAAAPPTVRGLSHLAPELQRRAGAATPACDIYSFGVMSVSLQGGFHCAAAALLAAGGRR